MKNIFYGLLIALIFSACKITTIDESGTKPRTVPNLIQTWYAAESVEAFSSIPTYNVIGLGFKTRSVGDHYYQDLYDDYHYNKSRDSYTAFVNLFDRLEITSDNVFNGIPAGDDLGEMFWILAESPYKWLKSKAQEEYDWSQPMPEIPFSDSNIRKAMLYEEPWFHPIIKKVSELSKEDLYLLSGWIHLVPVEQPELKDHNLTIKLFEGSVCMECTVFVSFESE